MEKILQNEKKHFIKIIRKYFNLENFAFLQGKLQETFLFCFFV